MTAKNVEILPKSISVHRNGRIDNSKPVSAGLVVTCFRPNELTDCVVGEVRNIALLGSEAFTDFPLDTPENILNNQLIKTKLTGQSVIKVELLVTLKTSVLNKVFSTLFGAAQGMASFSDPFASALVALSGHDLKDAIKASQITSLGQGLATLDSRNLAEELEIPISCNQTLYSVDEHDPFDLVGDELESRERLLEKGAGNGSVTLILREL